MQLSRATRTLASWVAILAVLMAALAPAVSHALGTRSASSWVEICTAQGATWVQPAALADDDSSAPAAAHTLDHCPYCSIHADTIGVPPASSGHLPDTALAHAPPAAFLAAPRTLHAWRSAQPRGPPFSC